MFPLCLICFDSNQIQIIARTPVGGYIPRQTILLEINVNNQSNIEISEFTIELIKVSIFSFSEMFSFEIYLTFRNYIVLSYFLLRHS